MRDVEEMDKSTDNRRTRDGSMPPHVDPETSSPQARILSTDPQGARSRRKVGVVLLEITNDEWENMYDWVLFLQMAGPELATAAQTFTAGHFPRSSLLVKLLNQGALGE